MIRLPIQYHRKGCGISDSSFLQKIVKFKRKSKIKSVPVLVPPLISSHFHSNIGTICHPLRQMAYHNVNITSNYYFHSQQYSTSPNSITTALKLLNLKPHTRFSPKELRDAYFTAAKLCHPDSPNAKIMILTNDDDDHDHHNSKDGSNGIKEKKDMDEETRKEHLTNQFHAITEAYELLQKHSNIGSSSSQQHQPSTNEYITKSEEEHFRQACIEFLGVDAEIVEESKRCPLFREWLKGRTVDAFLWNTFLMKHGGLAPMLRKKKVANLAAGDDGSFVGGKSRRRRR